MKASAEDNTFLKAALELAGSNIGSGGGPFGAVVVRGNQIVGQSGNRVVPENDPTAHAEVQAIRFAAKLLGTYDLSDCIIYSSCEPCPMCLGAIYWAGIKRIVYSADRHMAAAAGFSDELIYRELALPSDERIIVMDQALAQEGTKVFEKWEEYPDKIRY